MSEPLIVLCPGQGAQAVGMGKAWAEASSEARSVFEQADAVLGDRLGAPLSKLCFEGPDTTLNRTDVSQPAIYTASIASWRGLLAQWGLAPSEAPLVATAGLSLGEYTALHIAGAIDFEVGLDLVARRGAAMQRAAESSDGSMLALIGADDEQAADVCSKAADGDPLVCANFNAPGQIVLSGATPAIARAETIATDLGLRATRLTVAGAFHSPLMAPAAEELKASLEAAAIAEPRCPVLSNVSATPHAAEGPTSASEGDTIAQSVRVRLLEQLTSPVRWVGCCNWLAANAKGQLHELAPGKTLMGLMRRIDRSMRVTAHDQPDS